MAKIMPKSLHQITGAKIIKKVAVAKLNIFCVKITAFCCLKVKNYCKNVFK